ncbi:MAG: hypothetical protein GY765_14510 [bacterium]|nr:hypothetical protein [bacterium]
MKLDKFLRLAAICSVLGAITTILLIYLPGVAAKGFEAETALHLNSLYMSKLWILFAHPQFNILASLGIAFLFFKKYPELVVPGMLAMSVWAIAEISQQAYMIDAVNQIWRAGYLKEAEELKKTMLRTHLSGVEGISDSMTFLVYYGFGLGTLLMGIVMTKAKKAAKWIGWANILIGSAMTSAFLTSFMGIGFLLAPVNLFFGWMYPVLQPAVRIALGLWLWTQVSSCKEYKLSPKFSME